MSHHSSSCSNLSLGKDYCAPMTTSHKPSKLSSYCSWTLRKSAWCVIVGWWRERSGREGRLEEKERLEEGKVIDMEEKERKFMWFYNLWRCLLKNIQTDVGQHWKMLHRKWTELLMVLSAFEKHEVRLWFSMAHTGRHLESPQRAGSYSSGGRRRRWGNQERVVAGRTVGFGPRVFFTVSSSLVVNILVIQCISTGFYHNIYSTFPNWYIIILERNDCCFEFENLLLHVLRSSAIKCLLTHVFFLSVILTCILDKVEVCALTCNITQCIKATINEQQCVCTWYFGSTR